MLTEPGAVPDKPLHLKDLAGKGISKIKKKFVSEHFPLFYLNFTAEEMAELQSQLCELRSENLAFVLLFEKTEESFFAEEIIQFLKSWDNLSLKNLFKLFPILDTPAVQKYLRTEAMIELLWFREWNLALTDNRISHYPNLPWRSYLRKVNQENFLLAQALLENPSEEALPQILAKFLDSRKKVVCLFPKNWSKT